MSAILPLGAFDFAYASKTLPKVGKPASPSLSTFNFSLLTLYFPHMASLEEIRKERLKKLELLQQAGMDPYPNKVARTHTIALLKSQFSSIESSASVVSISGRIMAIRGQGALQFIS